MARITRTLIVVSALALVGCWGMPTVSLPKSSRIIGGVDVPTGEYEYVGLYYEGGNYGETCTAVLVGPRHVITAAHCITHPENGRVVFGPQELSNVNAGESFAVESEVQHPKFDSDRFENGYDIAVLTLTKDVDIAGVQPVNVKDALSVNLNSVGSAEAVGYGYDANYSRLKELRKVELPVVASNRCEALDMLSLFDFELYICAGGDGNGQKKGICGGDSGGPLVVPGTSTVIGLSSFVIGSCLMPFEGVFTSLVDPMINRFVTDNLPNGGSVPPVGETVEVPAKTKIKRVKVKNTSDKDSVKVKVDYSAKKDLTIKASLYNKRTKIGVATADVSVGSGSVTINVRTTKSLEDGDLYNFQVEFIKGNGDVANAAGILQYFAWPVVGYAASEDSIRSFAIPTVIWPKAKVPVTIEYNADTSVELEATLETTGSEKTKIASGSLTGKAGLKKVVVKMDKNLAWTAPASVGFKLSVSLAGSIGAVSGTDADLIKQRLPDSLVEAW